MLGHKKPTSSPAVGCSSSRIMAGIHGQGYSSPIKDMDYLLAGLILANGATVLVYSSRNLRYS